MANYLPACPARRDCVHRVQQQPVDLGGGHLHHSRCRHVGKRRLLHRPVCTAAV